MKRIFAALLLSTLMFASARADPVPSRTLIKDRASFDRLIGNEGISLQWIGWEQRGDLGVDFSGDLLKLHGGQMASADRGKLTLDGVVTEIGKDYFKFVGRIDIHDTPDAGRDCKREGEMLFRITQNRKYWRLQQMEQCDGLTDYVDIYF